MSRPARGGLLGAPARLPSPAVPGVPVPPRALPDRGLPRSSARLAPRSPACYSPSGSPPPRFRT